MHGPRLGSGPGPEALQGCMYEAGGGLGFSKVKGDGGPVYVASGKQGFARRRTNHMD